MVATSSPQPPPRREQVLAFIVERLVRDGRSPSLREIARALSLSVARVTQLVDQLIEAGQLERRPGVHGGLIVRDVAGARRIVTAELRRMGWVDDVAIVEGCTHVQLPFLAAISHLPDVDWPETP